MFDASPRATLIVVRMLLLEATTLPEDPTRFSWLAPKGRELTMKLWFRAPR